MTDPVERHVQETDSFTLRMERDPQLRSTITAVALFDRPPDWDVLNDRIERATRLVPTFRARLEPSPFHLAPPRWVLDPDFDLRQHLRRVGPGSPRTLETVLATAQLAASAAFDPTRPLWEFTLFEGLADGKAALLMKVHHALTDGIGGIQLAAHVVDIDRTPIDPGPLPPLPEPGPHGAVDALTRTVGFVTSRWARNARSLAGALPGGLAQSVRNPAEAASALAAHAGSVARFVRPMTTTLSPVMTRRSVHRHFDRLDVPTADLRSAAQSVGGSLNDSFLAALSGGMRRYHEHHGAPVDALRVTLPISLRRDDDPVGGNRITLARFELPVGTVDPVERMRVIGDMVRRIRGEPAMRYSEAIAGVFNLLPPGVTGGMLKHVDLVATNVPGFTGDIFVGGAHVEAFYPFAPTIGAAANIGLLSFGDTCNIGIATDTAAVTDPDVFVRCLGEGFDEVMATG
jgi:diacylglycerol O-acyltransferase / wax synthase